MTPWPWPGSLQAHTQPSRAAAVPCALNLDAGGVWQVNAALGPSWGPGDWAGESHRARRQDRVCCTEGEPGPLSAGADPSCLMLCLLCGSTLVWQLFWGGRTREMFTASQQHITAQLCMLWKMMFIPREGERWVSNCAGSDALKVLLLLGSVVCSRSSWQDRCGITSSLVRSTTKPSTRR